MLRLGIEDIRSIRHATAKKVLVKMSVAGVCHCDFTITGDGVMAPELMAMVEAIGGFALDTSRCSEGMQVPGVVVEVGPGVRW